MTYDVQVQSLKIHRFLIDAESEDEVRELYSRRGTTGLYQEADCLIPGDEDMQLISIAEAPDA